MFTRPGRDGPLARGLTLAAACGALVFAGCGDDDEETGAGAGGDQPQALAFDLKQEGKEATLTGPTTAEAGPVKIDFTNGAKAPSEVQLVRVDGDQTAEQVIKEIFDTEEGAPTPDYAHGAGGVGSTPPGGTGTSTQVLEPGTYHAIGQIQSEGEEIKPPTVTIEVEGEGGGELPDAPATITAVDYGFETEGLKAGKNTIKFDNAGEELHHVVAAPIAQGATFEDVKKFAMTEGEPTGPPPIEFMSARSTPVLDGGEAQVTDLELEKGKNVLLCFISDRAGGPPHVAKGMITEVDIP